MSYLVISVRKGHRRRLRDRTLIYRMNEAVGRWSMVDVFVVSILVALVQLGSIASIVPGSRLYRLLRRGRADDDGGDVVRRPPDVGRRGSQP